MIGLGKYALANELSALATGFQAEGGYTEVSSLQKAAVEGFKRYDKNPGYASISCAEAHTLLATNKWLEYSRKRLLDLGLSAEWLSGLSFA